MRLARHCLVSSNFSSNHSLDAGGAEYDSACIYLIRLLKSKYPAQKLLSFFHSTLKTSYKNQTLNISHCPRKKL